MATILTGITTLSDTCRLWRPSSTLTKPMQMSRFLQGMSMLYPTGGKGNPTALTSIMTDSLVDKYPNASWHPWFATFGNKYNTYSSEFTPERIDYLMYWASPEVAMCTRNFTMPMYNTQNEKGDIVSLSDHGALSAEFLIEKRRTKHSKKDSRPIMAKLAKNQRRKRLFYTKRT